MFHVELYQDYIEDNLEELKTRVQNNEVTDERCVNFMRDDALEDDLSHNTIGGIQEAFMKEAEAYLKAHYPGQFILYSDWCVHLCTVKFKDDFLSKSCVYRQC